MSFDSLKVYVRNHNTPVFYDVVTALPFVLARLALYGVPMIPAAFFSAMAQYAGLFLLCMMMMLLQRTLYREILAVKGQPAKGQYRRLLSRLVIAKIIGMSGWLLFLFMPLKAAFLYPHLVGYAFILSATAMYASISAPFTLLFYVDVGILAAFSGGVMFLNKDVPETVYVAGLIGLFTLYTLLIGRKITKTTSELLRTQKDLERSVQVAERANKSKSDFLAMMSHEIRTPMTGVLGMVDFLKETPLLPDQQNSLDTISECSKTLLNTLNDVLDISRMEAGKLAITPANFDFHGVLMNSYKILKPYATQKNIDIELKIDKDVPHYAYGDPSRLQQIIINLVNNAIKFTHKGGVTLTAMLREGALRVEVKDTGIGISEKNIKRLFQKFSQADGSISRKYGGSGLGLSISKQLVELMGGHIGVASQKDQGSVFWFDIPFRQPIAEKAPSKETEAFLNIPPQNILLVEDNEINQVIATRILVKKGHSVAVAVEGETALQMLKNGSFDLILMDCSLPGKGGIDITREIKQLGKKYADIPIIALTANAMEDNLRKCREAGMVDYVTKPFSSQQLYLALARHQRMQIGNFDAGAPPPADPAGPPPPADAGLNDKLKVIYEEFGPEYMTQLVGQSVREIDKLLKGLQQGLSSSDYETVHKSAHDLKGISGYIGMEDMQGLSEKIEKACARKDYAQLTEMIRSLTEGSAREVGQIEAMVRKSGI